MRRFLFNRYALGLNVFAMVFCTLEAFAQSEALHLPIVMPPAPALDVNVKGIDEGEYTAPHIPAIRTTRDGRVGLYIKRPGGGNLRKFTVVRPEVLDKPFDTLAPGIPESNASFPQSLIGEIKTLGIGFSHGVSHHVTLCEPQDSGPVNIEGKDVYTFYIVGAKYAQAQDELVTHTLVNGQWQPEFVRYFVDEKGVPIYRTDFNGKREVRLKGGEPEYRLDAQGQPILIDGEPAPIYQAGTGIHLFSQQVKVTVSNPKSTQAKIHQIEVLGEPVISENVLPNVSRFLEPMMTSDGHLLVYRISEGGRTPAYQWRKNNGEVAFGQYDIVYSYLPAACDISSVKKPYPISHAPFDSDVNQKYGFAAVPFRDTEGHVIEDGEELKGTYPWIDREGRNLFFPAINSRLYFATRMRSKTTGERKIHGFSRYPLRCENQSRDCLVPGEDNISQGLVALGAWTQGKMVLLDGAFTDSDYTVSADPRLHKEIQLYQEPEGLVWQGIGATRETNAVFFPEKGTTNTTFIDSLENIFNYYPNLFPDTPNDVVWRMSTGRGTADVGFDDYLNQHSVIIANMNASLTHNTESDYGDFDNTNRARYPDGEWEVDWYPVSDLVHTANRDRGARQMRHNDGFLSPHISATTGLGFGYLAPRIQNAATNEGVPAYGKTHGNIRIEPIAKGGIVGKGLWLDGVSGVSFDIDDAQLSQKDVYMSVFIDPRGPQQEAQLIRFPSGLNLTFSDSHLSLGGESIAMNAFGFEPRQWRHLGLQFYARAEQGAYPVDIYINGFVFARIYISQQPFTSGQLVLGTQGDNGIKAWVDEFKVIAQRPDMESACNHAYGTLVGVHPGSNAFKWQEYAALYPSASHGRVSEVLAQNGKPSYNRYACLHNYQQKHGLSFEKQAYPELIQTSIRQAIQFPEGPLLSDKPRPDSTNNAFCLSCHTENPGQSNNVIDRTLSVHAALGLTSELSAPFDRRRQPMQPASVISGNLQHLDLGRCDIDAIQQAHHRFWLDLCTLSNTGKIVDAALASPDSHHSIRHAASGQSLKLANWRSGQQGQLVTLESVQTCDLNHCAYRFKALYDNTFAIITSDTQTAEPDDRGALGVLKLMHHNIDAEDISSFKLRRNARILSNCGNRACEIELVPLNKHNQFRLVIHGEFALAKVEGNTGLQLLPRAQCEAQTCDFIIERWPEGNSH